MIDSMQAWWPIFAESLAQSGDLRAASKAVGVTRDMVLRSFWDRDFCEMVDEKHRAACDFVLRSATETRDALSLKSNKQSADRTLIARMDHKLTQLHQLKGQRLEQRLPELPELLGERWTRSRS